VKSTPMRGVKQFLKPDAYKQSEPSSPNSWETNPKEEPNPKDWVTRVTAYLLYNGSASWSQ
jgi:hypothetical protein